MASTSANRSGISLDRALALASEAPEGVDAAGLEARAEEIAARPIKRELRLRALDLAVRCMDLTSLEGTETADEIVALCSRAVRPDPSDSSIPAVAAVCLFGSLVPVAVEQLRGTGVRVAAVAGGFPTGSGPLDQRLAEVSEAVELGSDEIDTVLYRSLLLEGAHGEVFEEIAEAREVAGDAHLKVILETGGLGSYDEVRRAAVIAMAAGADFLKTSTGKITPGAALPSALCMMEAARDFRRETGRRVGVKVAGGIRTAPQAIDYVVLLHQTLGPEWMSPKLFRIGASSLLGDVLKQINEERAGRS